MGHIVIISGSPGVGKSTVARILADNSPHECSTHIHTDDFYSYIRKGYIEPWRFEANGQNIVVAETIASCAKSFAENGYETLVDGVIGSWNLKPWIELVNIGIEVHYVILRPSLEMTISRNANREKEISANVITHMWNDFADLGLYESHVINTTSQSPDETVIAIRKILYEDSFRLIRL